MTRADVSELVTILMACYPNTRFPDGTALAYENFLLDLDLEFARRALRTLVRSSKFLPTIAEIVAAHQQQVDSSQRHLTIAERITAEAAAEASRRSARGLPPFNDPNHPPVTDSAEIDRIVGAIG